MQAKEWLVPLALAGVTFVGLAFLPYGDTSSKSEVPRDQVDWVFPDGALRVPGETTALGVIRGIAAGHTCPQAVPRTEASREHMLIVASGTMTLELDCPTSVLVTLVVATRPSTQSTPHMFVAAGDLYLVSKDAPYLGRDGYNGTRVTIHVFDADGELVASNGNASEQHRLTRTFAPEQLPSGVWYLGENGTVPPGTQPLPVYARAFLGQMRPMLEGLPVGGVATTQTDALAGLYGRLYVTAQVAELVHAP